MQLVQRLHDISVAVRIIISGTPIQNNLMEMHSLFDFACEVPHQQMQPCTHIQAAFALVYAQQDSTN